MDVITSIFNLGMVLDILVIVALATFFHYEGKRQGRREARKEGYNDGYKEGLEAGTRVAVEAVRKA